MGTGRLVWVGLGIGLVLSTFLLTASGLSAQAAEPDPDARYQVLLTIAKAGQTVDWQALRFAYADRPSFSVFGDGLDSVRKQMFTALAAKDYSTCLKSARQILDQDFVDADAHLVGSICEDALGQPEKGASDRAMAVGLIRSMQTGDGKTPETALTVINVAEEYTFLRVNGWRSSSQALIRHGDHSYDLLNAVDQSGQPHAVYFLIDRVLADEAKVLKPK